MTAALLVLTHAEAATTKKSAKSSKAKPASSTASKARATKPPLAPAEPAPLKEPAVPVLGPGELPLLSGGAIVLDGLTGQTLYEKDADTPRFPASTTKVMTALLVIEEGNLDQEVEVTMEDAMVGESSLDIQVGDRFTRREALYGLMLKSANDVAHALARDNAGSVEAFAEKMTRRAQELGAINTRFKNPHGLHHVEHYTTPRDLALITRAAMQQPFFREVVGTQKHVWTNPRGVRALTNHNKLLTQFPGCTGVKTGFTNPARHTLATAALWGNREMISAVMYSTRQGKWDDSKLLLTHAFVHMPETSGPIQVTTAQGNHLPLR